MSDEDRPPVSRTGAPASIPPPARAAPVLPLGLSPGVDRLFRPKGHLSPTALKVLGILAILPLLSILVRSFAIPAVVGPGFDQLRELGNALSQVFSLSDIPHDQRDHVLYLLLLPTSALLVALARLTFGIRVLGFRSILISVGFHQSGIVPSLMLITVAVVVIVLVRPWLRRIRLPYYGRVSVILCIVATTMVGALLAGPWMRSDVIWGVAYFPVIVLGMLAEGIAHTLDRDNAVTAWWRAITTVLLAFLIALVCWVPALRSLLLQFPELVLTQIVAIVMISEFLDFRFFQDWDKRVAARLLPGLAPKPGEFRVAVVRNHLDADTGDPGRSTRARQALLSIRKIVGALRRGGYVVGVMEGDASLPRVLLRFIPPPSSGGDWGGIVLNLAPGTRGHARNAHVPAMLEMSAVPYVGPSLRGHAVASDRLLARTLMQENGVPTPAFRVMTGRTDSTRGVRYPAIVWPRYEPGVRPRMVADRTELREAVRRVVRKYRQEALVEERVTGRRIHVALLGNTRVVCLPLVEVSGDERGKTCPALLDAVVAEQIRIHATAAYRACGCRDYARVDVCVESSGKVWVLEARSLGILARHGAFVVAGEAAGYTFQQLICKIIEVARRRQDSDERPVLLHARASEGRWAAPRSRRHPRSREGTTPPVSGGRSRTR